MRQAMKEGTTHSVIRHAKCYSCEVVSFASRYTNEITEGRILLA
jgi:hypothetical protein